MAEYAYEIYMLPTAVTAAKTLLQIKPVTVGVRILEMRVFQETKTASELLAIRLHRHTGAFTAATVTSFTPIKVAGSSDPSALAVGGTTATGYNASAEPSGGTTEILLPTVWNVSMGEWVMLDIPEGRFGAATAELLTLKLQTAPAASMNVGAYIKFVELGR